MYKVTKITEIKFYTIVCELNNSILKKIDVIPILENQSHLNGISQLKDKSIFNSVAIGEMGELYWKDIITSKSNEKWNYDISPEYIYFNGITINP